MGLVKYLIIFMIKIKKEDLEHLKESMRIIIHLGEIIFQTGNI